MGFLEKRKNAVIERTLKEEYGIQVSEAKPLAELDMSRGFHLTTYEKHAEPLIELLGHLNTCGSSLKALSNSAWTVTMNGSPIDAGMLFQKNNGAYMLNMKGADGKFGKMADLKPADNGPTAAVNIAAIAWAIASYAVQKHYLEDIDKKLAEIQETVNDIKEFLEQDKQSQIKADLKILQDIVLRMSDILENEELTRMHLQKVGEIQREASRNMFFYETRIKKQLDIYISKNKKDKKKIEEEALKTLRQEYWYYRMSVEILALSRVVESLLSRNIKADKLENLKKDMHQYQNTYSEIYDGILETIFDYNYDKAGAKLRLGMANVFDFLGGVAEKTPLEKINVDEAFANLGKNTNRALENDVRKVADKVVLREERSLVEPIVTMIDELIVYYNSPLQITRDGDDIYLNAIQIDC